MVSASIEVYKIGTKVSMQIGDEIGGEMQGGWSTISGKSLRETEIARMSKLTIPMTISLDMLRTGSKSLISLARVKNDRTVTAKWSISPSST